MANIPIFRIKIFGSLHVPTDILYAHSETITGGCVNIWGSKERFVYFLALLNNNELRNFIVAKIFK